MSDSYLTSLTSDRKSLIEVKKKKTDYLPIVFFINLRYNVP